MFVPSTKVADSISIFVHVSTRAFVLCVLGTRLRAWDLGAQGHKFVVPSLSIMNRLIVHRSACIPVDNCYISV